MSYLENRFIEMLTSNYPDLEYVREYEVKEIQERIGKKVRYDFYFPILNLIIEIDGTQHYKPKKVGYEKWDEIRRMDDKKQMIAQNYGYNVFRIRGAHKNKFNKFFERILNKI